MNRILKACFMSFLILCSAYSLGGAAVAEVLGETFEETAVEAGMEAVTEALGETLDEATAEAVQNALTDAISNMTSDAAEVAGKAAEESAEAVAKALADTISDVVSNEASKIAEAITTDALTDTLADMSGSISESFSSASEDAINDLLEEGTISAEEASELVAEESTAEAAESGIETIEDAPEAEGEGEPNSEDVENENEEKEEEQKEEEKKTAGQKFVSLLGETGKMLGMGLIMMLPQSIMSGIVALNTKNANLADVAQPLKTGDFVAQVPTQFIDTSDPTNSLNLYALLPLSSTTEEVDSDMQATWPGLNGGPDSGDSITSTLAYGGIYINRYTMDPTFLQNANFACTAPAASYSTSLADYTLNSSSSPGKNVVLNNGLYWVADGTSGGNDPMALVGDTSNGFTALSAITYLLGKMQDAGTTYQYTEYDDFWVGSEGDETETTSSDGTTSDVMSRLLNCACIDDTDDYSSISDACVTTENDGTVLPTCLLANALATLQAGMTLDASGAQISNDYVGAGHELTEDELEGQSTTSEYTYNSDDDVAYQIVNGILTTAATLASTAVKNAGTSSSDNKSDSESSSGSSGSGGSSDKSLLDGVTGSSSTVTDAGNAIVSAITGSSGDSVSASAYTGFKSSNLSQQVAQRQLDQRVQGMALASSSDLDADELDNEALGPVVPVFGYDSDFGQMMSVFPAAQSVTDVSSAGAFAVQLNSLNSDAPTTISMGAPANNYAALGAEVYYCANTPFIRQLRELMGLQKLTSISDMSATGPYVEPVVFLDSGLNQVPLMVPGKKVVHGIEANNNIAYLPAMVMNPDIKYYFPLVGADLPEFYVQYGGVPYYSIDNSGGPYNASQMSSSVSDFLDTLGSINASLEQQVLDQKTALETQFLSGPFTKSEITTEDSLKFSGDSGSYVLYEGLNCYPVPMGNDSVSDLLLPVGSSGVVILPTTGTVNYYYGLVTDIRYASSNGYLIPSSFSSSCVTVGDDGAVTTEGATRSTSDFYYLECNC